jgi:hypothetical protein
MVMGFSTALVAVMVGSLDGAHECIVLGQQRADLVHRGIHNSPTWRKATLQVARVRINAEKDRVGYVCYVYFVLRVLLM